MKYYFIVCHRITGDWKSTSPDAIKWRDGNLALCRSSITPVMYLSKDDADKALSYWPEGGECTYFIVEVDESEINPCLFI